METGRIIAEYRDRYEVSVPPRVYRAELLGNLRYAAETRADLPAVGDWVQVEAYDGEHAIIHGIAPRKNLLERQSVSSSGEKQVLATNVDAALIVQALDRDFNLNRLERYLTLCHAHDIQPLIVLNKADLLDEAQQEAHRGEVQKRVPGVPVFVVSHTSGLGVSDFQASLVPGHTYCLLGSSGVGKSTLTNALLGQESMSTQSLSTSNKKGRHTTSHRALFALPNGSFLIDSPGLREVGLTESDEGLDSTFIQITTLAEDCRFSDCSHTHEKGCAVLAALDQGELSEAQFENYHRLKREQAHFQATVAEKRKRDKAFGKMAKEIMKEKAYKRGKM
ncbi:MAG: ribosome small subunit-dependent GTPase A [Bacteroidetes bacterium]|nr:MAG: ribosome small subunit-dependent GTPase A [Bacteroidota bacterium]